MDTRFKATKPEDIRMTMTITATLGEWAKVKQSLDMAPTWPCRELSDRIREMVREAEQTFVYIPKPEATAGSAPDRAQQKEDT
jgi:hypothetical protein